MTFLSWCVTEADAQSSVRVTMPAFRFRPLYLPLVGSAVEGRILGSWDATNDVLVGELGAGLDLVEISADDRGSQTLEFAPPQPQPALALGVDGYLWTFHESGEGPGNRVLAYLVGGHLSGNSLPLVIAEWRLRLARLTFDITPANGVRSVARATMVDLEVRPGEAPNSIRWHAMPMIARPLQLRFAGGVRSTWYDGPFDDVYDADLSISVNGEARYRLATHVFLAAGYELRGDVDDLLRPEHSIRMGALFFGDYGRPNLSVVASFMTHGLGAITPFSDHDGRFALGVGMDY